MSETKALVRRYFEAVNNRNLAALDEIVARDLTYRGWDVDGLDDLKQKAGELLDAFPNLSMTVEDLIAEEDRVAAWATSRGTQSGEYEGIPATGRSYESLGAFRFRFRDGKVVEVWELYDALSFMQQLGLLPEDEAGAVGME